jgi:UDP-glucose 4-epimerase
VKDVVAANAFFALKSRATGVFNVASGRQLTITDLALTIRSLAGSSCTIDYSPQRPGDVKHSVADVHKIQTAGLRRVCDLGEGLRATIEFFTKNLADIDQERHS